MCALSLLSPRSCLLVVLAAFLATASAAPTVSANQRGRAVNQVNTMILGCLISGGDPFVHNGHETGWMAVSCTWEGNDYQQIDCYWDPAENWQRWCSTTGFLEPHFPESPNPDAPILGDAPYRPPLAEPDFYQTKEDKVLRKGAASGVLANDKSSSAVDVSAELLLAPKHGRLNLEPDGSFVYRPDRNFHGKDSFVYAIHDNFGGEYVGYVEIKVTRQAK